MFKIKHSLVCIGRESESYAWIYVLMGNMLRGIGETPIQPLGISYIDDFAEEGESSFYLGNVQKILNFMITFPGSTFDNSVSKFILICIFKKNYWKAISYNVTLKSILKNNHIFLASDKIVL